MDPIYNRTVIHPVALAAVLAVGLLMLFLPRRYAFLPFIAAAVLIPLQQRIVIATLDFDMIRILVLLGVLRPLLWNDRYTFRVSPIDKAMILWVLFGSLAYVLLRGTPGAFVNRLGYALTMLGVYFLARMYIQTIEDVNRLMRWMALVSVPVAAAMLYEHTTGRNLFAVFGGVPEMTYIRDGRLRCQGAFAHPILAGTFGAAMLPVFLALFWQDLRGKILAGAGTVAAVLIVVNSASSGPVLAAAAGLFAMLLWPLRGWMRHLRWGAIVVLVVLQLAMRAPIWALMARAKVFGASTGYHRYLLFDEFIANAGEWFLLGVASTSHWGGGRAGLGDITNFFIRVAANGGFAALALLVVLLVLLFQAVGSGLSAGRGSRCTSVLCWSLGASLFAHVVNFMGVSYFDQIIVVLLVLFAAISTVGTLSEEVCTSPATSPVAAEACPLEKGGLPVT